jgi:hypothetical protein
MSVSESASHATARGLCQCSWSLESMITLPSASSGHSELPSVVGRLDENEVDQLLITILQKSARFDPLLLLEESKYKPASVYDGTE